MRIALIAEGSYPYVTGGVSSWVHSLISSMPEHEFVIYAIGASSEQQGKYKYDLPANVVQVCEYFLDAHLQDEGKWGKRYRISPQERDALLAFISGASHVDWQVLFNWMSDGGFGSAANFLRSRDYFDLLSELSETKFQYVPFTEWFWTVRSMVLPLFVLLREPIPQADLYHCVTTGYAGVIGSMAKWRTGKPLIITEHGIYSREREEEIIKAEWVPSYFKEQWIDYFYMLCNCAYESADQVITLFGRNREIQIELGCSSSKISIIPNGVEFHDYVGLPAKAVGDNRIHVGAIVRVVPIKDIKTMIQAFAIVKQEVPDSTFWIIGPYDEDPEYYAECQALLEALAVEEVTFTGSMQISNIIGKMDLLVLSSISEGQPLAVLEGMAAGKPFVTTDVGSCKELLYGMDDAYGPAGFVAPVMNVDSIAQAIIELCNHPDERVRMGVAGQERVRNLYSKQQFIQSYVALYESYEEGRTWQASALN
ncbi:GT4 family glycosyltransferase PelF [Paenibacillus sp. 481]|uniref:GT4 family glycosyltransferase PelF n=1 Tax=Paenibacillus sp. 481 TaxID=2835869 RepID=UPI001E535BD4|nr:GT4 family glycosyltransferase PelF [Paenibacillus sp. 481]UHA75199.1 GT4 family glycosyltransferase PelF [Paenibacillus sp. 481]